METAGEKEEEVCWGRNGRGAKEGGVLGRGGPKRGGGGMLREGSTQEREGGVVVVGGGGGVC